MQIIVPDQFRDEGLAYGRIERRGAAEEEREDIDVPELNDARDRQNPQRQGEGAHRRLRGDQEPALVEMIGGKAGPRHQQELRSEL